MVNRTRDLLDCVTVAGGVGAGINMMAGPLNTGFGACEDGVGIRDGVVLNPYVPNSMSDNVFILPMGPFTGLVYGSRSIPKYGYNKIVTRTAEGFRFRNDIPIYAKMVKGVESKDLYHAEQYYSQFEIMFGLIFTARLGFNPGEMLDFFLGCFGVDIYHDDLYPFTSLNEMIKYRQLDECETGKIYNIFFDYPSITY